jgi:hypothetical protein
VPYLDPEPLPRVTHMLEYYCKRELVYESDTVVAISGILRIVSTCMNPEMMQGVPVVALDYVILFHILSNRLGKVGRLRSFSFRSSAGWEASRSWNPHPDVSPIFPESFNHWLDHGRRYYGTSPTGWRRIRLFLMRRI